MFNNDTSDPDDPIVTYRTNTKFNRQYFKFVRRGAMRIDAASDGSTFESMAFINQDGGYVLVAKANVGGDFVVSGLPAGTYGRKYTTNVEYNVDLADVTIGDGETLSAAIPQSGVITVYAVGDGDSDAVPAVSGWSVIVMALLILVTGTLVLRPCRALVK